MFFLAIVFVNIYCGHSRIFHTLIFIVYFDFAKFLIFFLIYFTFSRRHDSYKRLYRLCIEIVIAPCCGD